MTQMTQQEMEPILFAHGMAELKFDVEETMQTVASDPHYEIASLGLAIDGRDAVIEIYRRLLAGNRSRDFQVKVRVDTVGANTLMQEAYVSFLDLSGQRVTGVYLSVVEFDPEQRKIRGERIYGDAVWGQLWVENLGADFSSVPGVSRIIDGVPTITPQDGFGDALAAS